jgi:hypothetical protein
MRSNTTNRWEEPPMKHCQEEGCSQGMPHIGQLALAAGLASEPLIMSNAAPGAN